MMKDFSLFCKKNNIDLSKLLKYLQEKRNVTMMFDPKQGSLLLLSRKETVLFELGANGLVRMPANLNGHWVNVMNSYDAA